MVQRLTYRKRHSYATKSNQHRIVKTPGGRLVYQTTKKRASGPKCPVTGKRIQGVKSSVTPEVNTRGCLGHHASRLGLYRIMKLIVEWTIVASSLYHIDRYRGVLRPLKPGAAAFTTGSTIKALISGLYFGRVGS